VSAAAQAAAPAGGRRNILPYAALTAAYCTHAGFFNPFLPLWLKSLGLSIALISVLTSIQAATRMVAPYAWGTLSDRTGERARLLRWGALIALVASAGLWFPTGGAWWLAVVLLVMFAQTSGMMPMTEAAVAQVVSQGGVFDTKLYGRVRLWGSLGFMLAVLGAGALFERVGMASFPLFVTVSLVVLVVFAYRLPDVKEAHHASSAGVSQPIGPSP
jgi:MFS transporter, PPP family, 3-phenylpropionic acid transporter